MYFNMFCFTWRSEIIQITFIFEDSTPMNLREDDRVRHRLFYRFTIAITSLLNSVSPNLLASACCPVGSTIRHHIKGMCRFLIIFLTPGMPGKLKHGGSSRQLSVQLALNICVHLYVLPIYVSAWTPPVNGSLELGSTRTQTTGTVVARHPGRLASLCYTIYQWYAPINLL